MTSKEMEPVPAVLPSEYSGDERAAWDRMDGESVTEHQWLAIYIKLGAKRSYKEVAQIADVPRDRVQRTAAKWGWPRRVELAQEYEDARRLQEIEGKQYQIRSEHDRMLEGAFEKLEAAISVMDPYKMSPRDLPAWIDAVVKYRRQNAGISDNAKKIEITGKDGGPIETVSSMSRQERQELLREMNAEVSRRLSAIDALDGVIDAVLVDDVEES
jgi:hypothetical protein